MRLPESGQIHVQNPVGISDGHPPAPAADNVDIRGASITELGNRSAALVRAVEAGERVIVHRHGRPVAVLLSVEAAIDAVVPYVEEMVALRRAAEAELRDGAAVELAEVVPWTPGWQ